MQVRVSSESIEESTIILSSDTEISDSDDIQSLPSIPQNTTESRCKARGETDDLADHRATSETRYQDRKRQEMLIWLLLNVAFPIRKMLVERKVLFPAISRVVFIKEL